MIKLGQAGDGRLVVATSQPLPADVLRVECYQQQRLTVLVFEDGSSDLMPLEYSPETAAIIAAAPERAVIAVALPGEERYGYEVPLMRIGDP